LLILTIIVWYKEAGDREGGKDAVWCAIVKRKEIFIMAYWDRISLTKPAPEVLDAVIPLLREQLGNAQSPHHAGNRAAAILAEARGKVLEIPVDSQGRINREAYFSRLDNHVALVAVQVANPEVGTIQPVEELTGAARDSGALFHADAIAAAGWIPLDTGKLDVDTLSLSAATFHGLPGAAALYIRSGAIVPGIMFGGVQERTKRPGTENIPAIAAMGVAADLAVRELPQRTDLGRKLASRLREGLSPIKALEFTGDPDNRAPGHVSMIVKYVEGEALLLMLDMKGVSAASGSSCTSKDLKISPVLMAMGLDHTSAQGSIVLSSSRDTTMDDAETVIRVLPEIVDKLRAMSPIWNQHKADR
jgi:cysteine desulfurase